MFKVVNYHVGKQLLCIVELLQFFNLFILIGFLFFSSENVTLFLPIQLIETNFLILNPFFHFEKKRKSMIEIVSVEHHNQFTSRIRGSPFHAFQRNYFHFLGLFDLFNIIIWFAIWVRMLTKYHY